MSPAAFASRMLGLGIEIHVRKQSGLLQLWPAKSYRELAESDKDFLRTHRDDLSAMVRNGVAPRLPEDHPGFPTPYSVLPDPDPEPDPVVWTWDYEKRITVADVVSVLGSLPSVNKRAAYELTRDALSERASSPVAHHSPLIERMLLSNLIQGD